MGGLYFARRDLVGGGLTVTLIEVAEIREQAAAVKVVEAWKTTITTARHTTRNECVSGGEGGGEGEGVVSGTVICGPKDYSRGSLL